jgi:hypothetical protein
MLTRAVRPCITPERPCRSGGCRTPRRQPRWPPCSGMRPARKRGRSRWSRCATERLSRANCAAIVDGVLRDLACARLASKLFGAIDLCPPTCAELWLRPRRAAQRWWWPTSSSARGVARSRCRLIRSMAHRYFGPSCAHGSLRGDGDRGGVALVWLGAAHGFAGEKRRGGAVRLPGAAGGLGGTHGHAVFALTVLNAAGVGARGAGEGGTVRRAIRGGGEVGNGCGGLRGGKGAAVVRCAAH